MHEKYVLNGNFFLCGFDEFDVEPPHGFPSRMTVGNMVKLVAGKV